MERIVYVDSYQGAARRVLVEDGVPVEIALDAGDDHDTVGNIYIGRVEKVLPHIGSAFVNVGLTKNAFLPLAETVGPRESDASQTDACPIRQGQDIVVQVTKSAFGEKGARLTMNLTFPGKYCVLMPTIQTIGISRHIQDPDRREALRIVAKSACPEGMGLLIRTAAGDASEDTICDEAKTLRKKWNDISSHVKARKAPALLFDSGNLTDGIERDTDAIILRQPLPALLEEKLSKSLRRKIWLHSGAYLVIDHCEAMTVIDVNSGKYISKSDMSEAVLRINREAAVEAARQIRLRDIGGIIVIDLIDMGSDEEREAVFQTFSEAIEKDRAKRHIHGFSPAGLLELTRRSIYHPFLHNRCPHCGGTGYQES